MPGNERFFPQQDLWGATVKAVLKSVKVLVTKATELTRIAETMAGVF
jgi:hypothetical protein